MEKRYSRVLTIAGSDSGGGAGIQADIKAISACGCYAASAITAITVQNTVGVRGVYPLPDEAISGQIDAVLDDIGADAVKIGMLHSSAVIRVVADTLARYQIRNIVLDPVMVATSGDKLLQDDAIESLQNVLIPGVRVITPNIPEASILLGEALLTQQDLPEAAQKLSLNGGVSVLLKAGHLADEELTDIFYNAEDGTTLMLKSKRIFTRNTHGTGCTLSSALAAFLARGLLLNDAVQQAKAYIDGAILQGAAYALGKGHGPVHHFYNCWQ